MAKSISAKTRKEIDFALQKEVGDIADNVVAQSGRDFSKYIFVIGLIGPILGIFQAIKIYASHSAAGVSTLYWGSYLVVASLWFGYGIYYRNRMVMIIYGLWIIVEIVILNGIFIYS